MAWWGELRLGREDAAWLDLERREALGPPPGDRYKPFQRLGTYARFSPWKANLIRALKLRSPDESTLASLKDFARLGGLMDIPEEQTGTGHILVQKGTDVSQRTRRHDRPRRGGPHDGPARPGGGRTELRRPGWGVDARAAATAAGVAGAPRRTRTLPRFSAGRFRPNVARRAAPLEGTDKARALYALGRDAVARYDTARAAELEARAPACRGRPLPPHCGTPTCCMPSSSRHVGTSTAHYARAR